MFFKNKNRLRGKQNTVPAPSKSKPGGSSGPQPPAGWAPVDPSPQTAAPPPLWPTPAGSDRQGLRPAAAACPWRAPWLALAGWQMGVLLGLILCIRWAQFVHPLWGSKSYIFIVIIVFFAHMRGPVTEENKLKCWPRLRRKQKFKIRV